MKMVYKTKTIRFVLILSVLLSGLTNCTDRWEEMNTDPNKLKNIPDEYLFTSAVRGAFNDASNDLHTTYGGQHAHIYVSNNWVRPIDTYMGVGNNDYPEFIFEAIYNSSIRNAVEVMHLTSEGEKYANKWHNVQAQIIAVVSFSKLTDAFGDVPYFEAGMGKYGNTTPKYDKQEEIYTDMLAKLTNAIAVLEEAEAENHIYASDVDPIYQGNVENWIRFANSYRLHLAMRARFVDPGKYEPVIKECLSQPLMDDNSQNPILLTSDSKSDMYNPWWGYWNASQKGTYNLVWAEKFITALKETNDPRLSFYATKNPAGEYAGFPNGLSDEEYSKYNRKDVSIPSEQFFAKTQPIYLITAGQICLYKAEAALFNIQGVGGDANKLYQDAIALCMEQWDIDDEFIDTYLENEKEATLSADQEDNYRKISTQMWITSVPNAFESWCTIRRTGYPVIARRTGPEFEKGVTDGFMPIRVLYPATKERSINGDNMQEAIDRLPGGEDKVDIKVWWDAR
ncbi:MAG: SusD/RagB family nutrient-binding outer membrane lipoprotein [Marinilabiliaceae bacterium]|nr:SusD/RagB family nutrient-binding outer membrane lipoprotein [Marinilabiliaceae bacterium]